MSNGYVKKKKKKKGQCQETASVKKQSENEMNEYTTADIRHVPLGVVHVPGGGALRDVAATLIFPRRSFRL